MQGRCMSSPVNSRNSLNKKLKTGNPAVNVVFVPAARDRPPMPRTQGRSRGQPDEGNGRRQNPRGILRSHLCRRERDRSHRPCALPYPVWKICQARKSTGTRTRFPTRNLLELSERFQREVRAIKTTPADEDLQPGDVLEMVNAGLVPMTVGEDRLLGF